MDLKGRAGQGVSGAVSVKTQLWGSLIADGVNYFTCHTLMTTRCHEVWCHDMVSCPCALAQTTVTTEQLSVGQQWAGCHYWYYTHRLHIGLTLVQSGPGGWCVSDFSLCSQHSHHIQYLDLWLNNVNWQYILLTVTIYFVWDNGSVH